MEIVELKVMEDHGAGEFAEMVALSICFLAGRWLAGSNDGAAEERPSCDQGVRTHGRTGRLYSGGSENDDQWCNDHRSFLYKDRMSRARRPCRTVRCASCCLHGGSTLGDGGSAEVLELHRSLARVIEKASCREY